MRLVQIAREGQRRIALVDGEELRLLAARWPDIYSLAMDGADSQSSLASAASAAVSSESLPYGPIYEGKSNWRLLPAFDHPTDAAHCMVSGTGLTHKASAENRAAMHKKTGVEVTDSARMYQMGLEAGSPALGEIGVQPEWFFKGDGSILRGHGEGLTIPPYGLDGGEEPEIAGAYIISRSGEPLRVGLTVGNEFSDHVMEKKNYLYLAPSKLRNCSIGPELTLGEADFEDIAGTVSLWRNNAKIWAKNIWTGQKNMSHSVANLEHHHFKYEAHRRPGDVHIHFFGADAFSFGDRVELAAGDVMEVSFPAFGRALRNPLRVLHRPEEFTHVRAL
jgi:hypothetical protein